MVWDHEVGGSSPLTPTTEKSIPTKWVVVFRLGHGVAKESNRKEARRSPSSKVYEVNEVRCADGFSSTTSEIFGEFKLIRYSPIETPYICGVWALNGVYIKLYDPKYLCCFRSILRHPR